GGAGDGGRGDGGGAAAGAGRAAAAAGERGRGDGPAGGGRMGGGQDAGHRRGRPAAAGGGGGACRGAVVLLAAGRARDVRPPGHRGDPSPPRTERAARWATPSPRAAGWRRRGWCARWPTGRTGARRSSTCTARTR